MLKWTKRQRAFVKIGTREIDLGPSNLRRTEAAAALSLRSVHVVRGRDHERLVDVRILVVRGLHNVVMYCILIFEQKVE